MLARNVETHDLVMVPSRVKNPRETEALLRKLLWLTDEEQQKLSELFRVGIENRDRFDSLVIRQDLIGEYCTNDVVKLESLAQRRRTLWSAQTGRSYYPATGSETRCPHDTTLKVSWNTARTRGVCPDGVEYVTGASDPGDGSPLVERTWSLRCPADGQLYSNEKAIVEADLYQMPGIEVRSNLRRIYPIRNLTSHLVGYIGAVSRKDLETTKDRYGPGDRTGRSGVERSLEQELRGRYGERHTLIERMGRGGPSTERPDPDQPDVPVTDGLTVRLTIDVELQALAERAMRYHKSGAVVVADARNGEILALFSKPTFDPNAWSGRLSPDLYATTTASPFSPLLNKALTAYAPGSVYKLVTASAALHSHLTDSKREIFCPGYFEYGGRRFRCHQRTGHGTMDMVHALARSCDVYFYKLGEELGMDTLHDYALNMYGLGLPTGIEVGESLGIVPTKEWHKKQDGVFMPGFTVSTAVGQKDIKLTPLQVTRAYVALANGGRLLDLHVVKALEKADGTPVRTTELSGDKRLPLTDEEMALLKEGFWRTVNDEHGTAFDTRLEGIEVAGKTGTAEAAEHKAGVGEDIATWLLEDHAWFAGYAPARDPQIVVTVFVEHGHSGGKMAGPVAMQVIAGYLSRHQAASPGPGGPLPNPIHGGHEPAPDAPSKPSGKPDGKPNAKPGKPGKPSEKPPSGQAADPPPGPVLDDPE